MMRLSVKAMAVASGLLWGAAILCVGLIHLADPNYGTNFLQMTSSVYPWFHDSRTAANVAVGTIEGLIDGAIAGLILAWLYNAFARVRREAQQSKGQEAHTM
jgi:hypothetical protein